jgi:hypothetical protein
MKFHSVRWSLALTALGLTMAHASADTVVAECSEAALDAALSAGGRIVLQCTGTITHRTTKVITTDTLLEAANGQVTLSGGGTNRLFTINPGVTLSLRGLNLTQGNHQGANGRDGGALEAGESGKPGFGAAIFNDGGTLIAIQVTFSSNQVAGGNGGQGAVGGFFGTTGRNGGRGGAATGGAILNRSGALLLTNCTFTSNQAMGGDGGNGGDGASGALNGNGGDGGDGGRGQGGAIHSEGSSQVVLVDCTFSGNLADGGSPGEPGWAGSTLNFDGSPGAAGIGEGGAVFGSVGSIVGLRSTFKGNRVQGADGFDGLKGLVSGAGMDGSRGGAARGGAVAVNSGHAAFTNASFFANRATGGAGGDGGEGGGTGFGGDGGDGGRGGSARGGSAYHASVSTATFVHCTFSAGELIGGTGGSGGAAGASTANRGGRGSTGLAEGANIAADSPAVELFLTLLAYGNGGPNTYGPIHDGGFNLSSDDTPAFDHDSSLNQTDPLLGNLANNGGLTQTLALSPDSPARDRGGDIRLVETDQRGFVRFDAPDAGAFEYGSAASLGIVAIGNQVIVSWPVSIPPMRPLSTSSLLTPNWEPVTGAIQIGSVYAVTNALSDSTRFYRLTE